MTREVVDAYVNATPLSSGAANLFTTNVKTVSTRAEYQTLAVGDIGVTLDVLHTREHALQGQQALLEQQESVDQAATARAAGYVQQSANTQREIEVQSQRVNGQLAAAIAAQQAAQAAAVAAAERAAQAAAARQAQAAAAKQAEAAAAKQAQAAPATPAQPAQPASVPTTTPPATNVPAPVPTTTPPATSPPASVPSGGGLTDPALNPFLQCALQAESSGNYGAVSANGVYMGGFQFSQPTWDQAARLAGLPNLIGVPPNVATPAEQDTLAVALYSLDGQTPWYDSCRT